MPANDRAAGGAGPVGFPILVFQRRADEGVSGEALQGEVPLAAHLDFSDEQLARADTTAPSTATEEPGPTYTARVWAEFTASASQSSEARTL